MSVARGAGRSPYLLTWPFRLVLLLLSAWLAPMLFATPADAAAATYIGGPGCPHQQAPDAVAQVVSGQWWAIGDGDYKGPGLAGPCTGATWWAWTQTNAEMEYVIYPYQYVDGSIVPYSGLNECWFLMYVPTDHAGAYAVRYDFYVLDGETGRLIWFGWPGHTVDQNTLGGDFYWEPSYGFKLAALLPIPLQDVAAIVVTERDDASADQPGRNMGAGDIDVACE